MELDEWIVGHASDGKNEYIIHLSSPRFIARFDDSEYPEMSLADGLSVTVDGVEFHSVLWLDGNPGLSDADLLALFGAANAAIDRYSFAVDDGDDDDA